MRISITLKDNTRHVCNTSDSFLSKERNRKLMKCVPSEVHTKVREFAHTIYNADNIVNIVYDENKIVF